VGTDAKPVPEGVRLTQKQADALAKVDTALRGELAKAQKRQSQLPTRGKMNDVEEMRGKPLAFLVERSLTRQVRDAAILIDPEEAGEFGMARKADMAAWRAGEEGDFCPLCCATRAGMEAPFAFYKADFRPLTEAQQKEADEIASLRQDLRAKWVAALRQELTEAQIAWLQSAQMRWLEGELKTAVTFGLALSGGESCATCAEEAIEKKCLFCGIVEAAVEAWKEKRKNG
jgi:hypothetical protein